MKTGLVRWEWHSLDHVGASESEVEAPTRQAPWDYFHLNSIDPEPDGNILISARSTWAGYQLEGGSGKVLWRLGGNTAPSRWGRARDGLAARRARARQRRGDVLRRRLEPADPPPVARRADRARPQDPPARLVSAYTHPNPPLLAASQGNMQTLAGRQHRHRLRRGARDQRVRHGRLAAVRRPPAVRHVLLPRLPLPWSGRPLSPPAVLASLNNTGEETIVHVSWNGATGVASWRVLAGKQPGSLTAQATIPVERLRELDDPAQEVRLRGVQALDSAGRVLGTSQTVRVISYAARCRAGAVGMRAMLSSRRTPRRPPGGRRSSRPVWTCACAWSCVVVGVRRPVTRGARFAAAARHRDGARQDGQ